MGHHRLAAERQHCPRTRSASPSATRDPRRSACLRAAWRVPAREHRRTQARHWSPAGMRARGPRCRMAARHWPRRAQTAGAARSPSRRHRDGRNGREEGRLSCRLAQIALIAHQSARMAELDGQEGDHPHGSVYRVAGALTITRAATTAARDRCDARSADHRPLRDQPHGHGRRVARLPRPSATAARR